MTRLAGLLPSVTDETKVRLEKLILELYQFVNSGGKLLKESRHNAKYVVVQFCMLGTLHIVKYIMYGTLY